MRENWIWRELPAVFADFAEAGAVEGVGWQAHIDDVEEVEELGPELQIDALGPAPAAAERGVLDEGEIEIVKGGATELLRPRVPKTALIGPAAFGDMDGDGEEVGGVVDALAEVVLPLCAGGGEMRGWRSGLGGRRRSSRQPVCWIPE